MSRGAAQIADDAMSIGVRIFGGRCGSVRSVGMSDVGYGRNIRGRSGRRLIASWGMRVPVMRMPAGLRGGRCCLAGGRGFTDGEFRPLRDVMSAVGVVHVPVRGRDDQPAADEGGQAEPNCETFRQHRGQSDSGQSEKIFLGMRSNVIASFRAMAKLSTMKSVLFPGKIAPYRCE